MSVLYIPLLYIAISFTPHRPLLLQDQRLPSAALRQGDAPADAEARAADRGVDAGASEGLLRFECDDCRKPIALSCSRPPFPAMQVLSDDVNSGYQQFQNLQVKI